MELHGMAGDEGAQEKGEKSLIASDIIEKIHFSPNHSAYRKFVSDEQGRIFVENWEKTKDGQSFYYDIFDPEGEYAITDAKRRPGIMDKREAILVTNRKINKDIKNLFK
jgi:hypothetical protein